MVFLHGLLNLEIREGRDLPDVDEGWFSRAKDKSDPYVTVDTQKSGEKTCRLAKTPIIQDNLNPKWESIFHIEVCHDLESLLIQVKDMDMCTGVDNIGHRTITVDDLMTQRPIEGWFSLYRNDSEPAGEIHIMFQFLSTDTLIESNEVSNCVFPLRTGCDVTLYQDACTPAVSPVIDVPGPDGSEYVPGNMFIEVANAIRNAQKFIYVCGWSVSTEICLERGEEGGETVGDLLKAKAADGVRVLVMIWNEALSTDIAPCGMMGTHDE